MQKCGRTRAGHRDAVVAEQQLGRRRGLRSPSEAGCHGTPLKPSVGEEVKELCSQEVKACQSTEPE